MRYVTGFKSFRLRANPALAAGFSFSHEMVPGTGVTKLGQVKSRAALSDMVKPEGGDAVAATQLQRHVWINGRVLVIGATGAETALAFARRGYRVRALHPEEAAGRLTHLDFDWIKATR